MESVIHKNDQLLAVRDASMRRLTRFANMRESDVQHCYLFVNDQFVGVRYRVGAFVASWFCSEGLVSIHRGENLIDQFPIRSDQRQAA